MCNSMGVIRLSEMEFITLTVGVLREFLEDVPDEYTVMVGDVPVMNFDVDGTCKEFVFKPGDLND